MKEAKAATKSIDFRVWCEHCSIRIAPHEEKIMVDGKAYHSRCHSKYVAPSERVADGAASRKPGKSKS